MNSFITVFRLYVCITHSRPEREALSKVVWNTTMGNNSKQTGEVLIDSYYK